VSEQPGVTNVVKAAFDVSFKNPFRGACFAQCPKALFHRICRGAASPETIGVVVRKGFGDRFQGHQV
jgi:hypothetical protein